MGYTYIRIEYTRPVVLYTQSLTEVIRTGEEAYREETPRGSYSMDTNHTYM